MTAGKAPEAEEERDRLVRGLGCFAAALSCAVEGLQSKGTLENVLQSNTA